MRLGRCLYGESPTRARLGPKIRLEIPGLRLTVAPCGFDLVKEFLAAKPLQVAFCELDDPGLDLDIDLPADYDKAVRLAM
jgi:hypothetical protein